MAQGSTFYLNGALSHAAVTEAQRDPATAIVLHDHFMSSIASADTIFWNATIGTSFTVAHSTSVAGGVWTLTAPASGTGTGGQIQSWTPLVTPTDGTTFGFEARIKIDNLTAAYGAVFIGFQDVAGSSTTPALACTNAGVATTNIDVVGVAIKTDGTVVSVCQNGSTTGTVASLGTLVADTYYKIGFVVEGRSRVTYYINGVKVGTVTTAGAIPNEALYAEVGVYGGASGGKAANVDYVVAWVKDYA